MADEARWSFAEATLIRAAGITGLLLFVVGLVAPGAVFPAWGLVVVEPATFYRYAMVAEGVLGLALVRAVRLPRREGRLTVETIALVKLAFFAVVFADAMAHKIPGRAVVASVVDLVFGAPLYRVARRSS